MSDEKIIDAERLSQCAKYRGGNWLSSEDLTGAGVEEITATISDFKIHEDATMPGGQKKSGGVLYLKETERLLMLNKVNRDTLTRLFGDAKEDFIGEKICIYIDHNVRFGRDTVDGLRIRAVKK